MILLSALSGAVYLYLNIVGPDGKNAPCSTIKNCFEESRQQTKKIKKVLTPPTKIITVERSPSPENNSVNIQNPLYNSKRQFRAFSPRAKDDDNPYTGLELSDL